MATSAAAAANVRARSLPGSDASRAPKAQPSARPLSPFAAVPEAPAPEELAFIGELRETKRAGSYSYLLVVPGSPLLGPRWVATASQETPPIGSQVSVRAFAVRTAFESPRLKLSFDRLLFGLVALYQAPSATTASH